MFRKDYFTFMGLCNAEISVDRGILSAIIDSMMQRTNAA